MRKRTGTAPSSRWRKGLASCDRIPKRTCGFTDVRETHPKTKDSTIPFSLVFGFLSFFFFFFFFFFSRALRLFNKQLGHASAKPALTLMPGGYIPTEFVT
ncbi:hypothetical protein VN97_g4303 [Penicillium thymicola]|uniref:Uncharacterized protein n=1 Tax=Penicillium thymicola TaxID=293382 RepID=A0AAI9XA17_PENTH|nr:hypothetical protein VN97_g4303 [Penicillium thymicola]